MTANTLRNSTCEARLLSADDPSDVSLWNSLVDATSTPDVYYRPGYAKAYQAIGHGKAVAVLIEARGLRALFPLLLKPLNALMFAPDETGFDAATSYGYGGLLLLDGAEGVGDDRQLDQHDRGDERRGKSDRGLPERDRATVFAEGPRNREQCEDAERRLQLKH